jgi:acetyl-CoA carboxylase biotin carboxylase subunit
MFHKVLIANRGEIAVRLIRALRDHEIGSVAVFSDVDRKALHVRLADEAEHIGPAASSLSYLRIENILQAAKKHGADAIHPGYGFLSENANFAEACEKAGIVFIGPSAESIRLLGSKTQARLLAKQVKTPIVPGTEEPAKDLDQARAIARELGYPVLLKAAAGGGGKGMRLVASEAEFDSSLRDAASEAERAFQNSEIYIEKAVVNPRHVEIQLLGDKFGHMIHLGERECSLQRRHQKVIEECPSPLVSLHPEMRQAMGEAAIRVAQAAGYYNAGTAEFLVDQDRNFYFLEMNTRLQVEHPVTELVTGLDLVHWQLQIAAGERLTIPQEDVRWRGSAIQCRLYAEDPWSGFMPSPGQIEHLREPSGPGVRLDSGVYQGYTVPMDYDPLLAKLVTWGEDRLTATARMLRALDEYTVTGIQTNLDFFREILRDPGFVEGRIHTGFIYEFLERREPAASDEDLPVVAALAALAQMKHRRSPEAVPQAPASRWQSNGRARSLR